MHFKRYILLLLGLFSLCNAVLGAEDLDAKGDSLQIPAEQITGTMRQTSMPELGEGRLSKILSRYYIEGLGGDKKWGEVSSLKFAGTLELESGEFELVAYQKKPNLIKMTIRSNQSSHGDLVLAYDGKHAWQQKPGREAKPQLMNEDEARRFIHSSSFRNHLLYPFALGKKIAYIDTVPVEGSICHQIRVTLDTGYQVDYYIDIRSHLEVKAVNTDLRTGLVSSVVYKNYSREFDIPIAMQVDSFENGKWVSTLTADQVKVNAGVIPWMFKMR